MNNANRCVMITAISFLLATSSLWATPVVVDEFFDATHGAWTDNNSADDGTISLPTHPYGGSLVVTVNPGVGTGYGVAFTVDSHFTGDYPNKVLPGDASVTVEFTLTSISGGSAADLAVYFQSGTHAWVYALPAVTGTQGVNMNMWSTGWQPYSGIDIGNPGAWQGLWETDVMAVDGIGFFLGNASPGESVQYTFSEFGIHSSVPEPETVWMILAVALSLGMTFRGRLADLAGQMKGRFVKA